MKNILLLVPPSDSLTLTPPIGLGYIASALRSHNYRVNILDFQKEPPGNGKFSYWLNGINPDIIGISILSPNYVSAKEMIGRIKQSGCQAKIVLGGPHSTALPEAALKETGADFLIRGEGEYAFLELVDYLDHHQGDLSAIENLCYRENGKIKIKPITSRIENLDDIPFPAWDLIDPREYPAKPHQLLFNKYPIAPIVTSRGCPFSCTFCSASLLFGKKIRRRSAKNVVDEIELLVNKYGVKEIHFEDDNFTILKEHAQEICREIIRRDIRISWVCPNGIRVDRIDQELVCLMKKSGCYRLYLGIESGSQEILDQTRKKLDLKQIPRAIKIIKDQGMQVGGFFILGLPGETKETALKTLRFIDRLGLDLVNIGLYMYLPGTAIFNERYGPGQYSGIKWQEVINFIGQSAGGLSRSELKNFQRIGLIKFYCSPKTLAFLIKNIKIRQFSYASRVILKYMSGTKSYE